MSKSRIYIDTSVKDEIRRELNRTLELAKKAATLLSKYGFSITKENILDAVTITKESSKGNSVTNQAYIGGNTENRVLLYECLYSFGNCGHLDEEFQEKLENSLMNVVIPVLHRELEAKAKEDYDRLRGELHSLFHPSIGSEVNTKHFVKWFEVVNGEVTLPDNTNELIEEASSINCESDKAEEAFELHKKAAKAIEDFLSLFRKELHPSDVGMLFNVVDGNVYPAELNYNKYL